MDGRRQNAFATLAWALSAVRAGATIADLLAIYPSRPDLLASLRNWDPSISCLNPLEPAHTGPQLAQPQHAQRPAQLFTSLTQPTSQLLV